MVFLLACYLRRSWCPILGPPVRDHPVCNHSYRLRRILKKSNFHKSLMLAKPQFYSKMTFLPFTFYKASFIVCSIL